MQLIFKKNQGNKLEEQFRKKRKGKNGLKDWERGGRREKKRRRKKKKKNEKEEERKEEKTKEWIEGLAKGRQKRHARLEEGKKDKRLI